MVTHRSIDPDSNCPGWLLPLSFKARRGLVHRGRYKCDVCGYRTTYVAGMWSTKNPLSPLQKQRIAEANEH
jgi:hypothetical protein